MRTAAHRRSSFDCSNRENTDPASPCTDLQETEMATAAAAVAAGGGASRGGDVGAGGSCSPPRTTLTLPTSPEATTFVPQRATRGDSVSSSEDDNGSTQDSVEKGYRYACEVCFKRFERKETCKRHQRLHNGNFVCKICGHASDCQSKYDRHQVVHTRERPYKCDWPNCRQGFTQNSSLQSHKRSVHEKIKPFECTQCSKKFSTRAVLKRHIVTHNSPANRERFMCKNAGCGKYYANQANLRRHEREGCPQASRGSKSSSRRALSRSNRYGIDATLKSPPSQSKSPLLPPRLGLPSRLIRSLSCSPPSSTATAKAARRKLNFDLATSTSGDFEIDATATSPSSTSSVSSLFDMISTHGADSECCVPASGNSAHTSPVRPSLASLQALCRTVSENRITSPSVSNLPLGLNATSVLAFPHDMSLLSPTVFPMPSYVCRSSSTPLPASNTEIAALSTPLAAAADDAGGDEAEASCPVHMSIVRPPPKEAPEETEEADMVDNAPSPRNSTLAKEAECVSAMLSLGTPRARSSMASVLSSGAQRTPVAALGSAPVCVSKMVNLNRQTAAPAASEGGGTIDLSLVEPPSTPPPPPEFKLERSALARMAVFSPPVERSLLKGCGGTETDAAAADVRSFNFTPQRQALMEIPLNGPRGASSQNSSKGTNTTPSSSR